MSLRKQHNQFIAVGLVEPDAGEKRSMSIRSAEALSVRPSRSTDDAFHYHSQRLTESLRRTADTLAAMEAQRLVDAEFVARWNAMTIAEAVAVARFKLWAKEPD